MLEGSVIVQPPSLLALIVMKKTLQCLGYLCGLWVGLLCINLQAETSVRLRNGYVLRGIVNQLPGLNQNSFAAAGRAEDAAMSVLVVDDGLKRTFVHGRSMVDSSSEVADLMRRITIWQPVANSGKAIAALGLQTSAENFNEYGRRWVTTQTPEGPVSILQGITEINARYVEMQGLQAKYSYSWDARVSTGTIPSDTLQRVLYKATPRENLDKRLDVVNFYIEAERFADARRELSGVIRDFPAAADLPDRFQALTQREAQGILSEAMMRRSAGQHQLAMSMLENFISVQGIARVTRLEAQDRIQEMKDRAALGQKLLQALRDQVAQLPAGQEVGIADFLQVIEAEMTLDTITRLSDFERLGMDDTIPLENRVALGIGGWLLGSGSGMQNLAVARSLIKVRSLVSEYLSTADLPRRQSILLELQEEEGAQPEYVARLIAMLPPPVALTDPEDEVLEEGMLKEEVAGDEGSEADEVEGELESDQGADEEEATATPVVAQSTDPPGYYEISIDTAMGPVSYSVQLPLEYHPLRRYPAILALHPLGATGRAEVDWWSGAYSAELGMRTGQATRQGYIVVAPNWTRPSQRGYEYTPIEHHRVLAALRDAMRRVSIDSDRVYIAGHLAGGSAAWDIALAHPDLWAGLINIGGDAGKYVMYYGENAKYVPIYYVTGDIAGAPSPLFRNGTELDDYMRPGYDVMVTLYRGRGDELFYEDITNIFDWMRLSSHRRPTIPRDFTTATMREGDQFFWWLELKQLNEAVAINPIVFEHVERRRAGSIEGKILDRGAIKIRGPARGYDVLLTPEMGIDLAQPVVINEGTRKVTFQFDGSLEFMLEDARRRCDRQHVFWAKVSVP